MFRSWYIICLSTLPAYVTRRRAFAVPGTRSDQFDVERLKHYKRLILTFLNLRNRLVWFNYGIRRKVPNVEASIPDWCDRYSLNEKKNHVQFVRYRACRHSTKKRNRNQIGMMCEYVRCAEGRSKSPTPTPTQRKRYQAARITMVTRQKSIDIFSFIGRKSQSSTGIVGKEQESMDPARSSFLYVPLD